jgi:hypothetical protein
LLNLILNDFLKFEKSSARENKLGARLLPQNAQKPCT